MQNQSKSRGFSVIEVLIAVAVLGILSAGVASLTSVMSTQMRKFDSKFNNIGLAQELRSALTNPTQCTAMLANMTIPIGNAETEISVQLPNTGSGQAITVAAGQAIPQRKVFVRSLTLERLAPAGISPRSLPIYSSSMVLLSAVYDGANAPTSANYKGAQFNKLIVGNVSMEMNGNVVQNCQMSVDRDQLCRNLGGNFNTTTNTCSMPVDTNALCSSMGGAPDANGRCVMPSTGGGGGGSGLSLEQVCASMSGSFVNGRCNLPSNGSTTIPNGTSAAETCGILGGHWSGGRCTLSSVPACPPGSDSDSGGFINCHTSCLDGVWRVHCQPPASGGGGD